MGASNLATMDSSSARVDWETGKSWFRPKVGGNLVRLGRRGDGPAGRGWGNRRSFVDLDGCLVSGSGGRS